MLLILAFPVFAQADQEGQVILLKDGSIMKGKLVALSNSSYTIQTPSAGVIQVPTSEVQSITSANPRSSANSGTGNSSISVDTVNSVKENMMNDSEIMSLIQELVKDPEIAEMMKDPSLLQDALSMDQERIQNNPQVQKLVQNPTMQKILKLTAQKMHMNKTRDNQ